MTAYALQVISDGMEELGLNYAYMEFKEHPGYPYFTGEYMERSISSEDGEQDATFIINGFTKGNWLELEDAKSLIEDYFDKIDGKIVTGDTTVAIFYDNAFPIRQAEVKRYQINLTIKEWKVD